MLDGTAHLPDTADRIACRRSFSRREFLVAGGAMTSVAAAGAALGPARAWAGADRSLDPVDANIRYGITGSLWGDWVNGSLRMWTDVGKIAADIARVGLQGFEPYGGQVGAYVSDPLRLRKTCNVAGIVLIDVGDLPPGWGQTPHAAGSGGGGANQTSPWLDREGNAELIERMASFARDFLAPCGCDHWKTNMGSRPEGGPSEDQLKRLAGTLNAIGQRTIGYGVRLAPHPHIWGPMEREHEVRKVIELTDPRYVWLTTDTGHLTLGGMDAVKIISDYFSRIAEVHLKDTFPRFRGNKATPTREEFRKASVYHDLGSGGVEFPAVLKVLRDRNFKGWVVLDLDAPRPNDGTGSIDDNLADNVRYLRERLHVRLPKTA